MNREAPVSSPTPPISPGVGPESKTPWWEDALLVVFALVAFAMVYWGEDSRVFQAIGVTAVAVLIWLLARRIYRLHGAYPGHTPEPSSPDERATVAPPSMV